MNYRKLNQSGVAHHFVLALAVVGIVSAFAFQAVSGSAALPAEDQASINAAAKARANYGCTSRPLLGVGNAGPCVKLVQSKVGVTADGNFGPKTKAAVIAYQKKKGLAADGVVGPKTWAKMLGSSASVSAQSTSKPTPVKLSGQDDNIYCRYQIGEARRNNVVMTVGQCAAKEGRATKSRHSIAYGSASPRIKVGGVKGDNLRSAKLCVRAASMTSRSAVATVEVRSIKMSVYLKGDGHSKMAPFTMQTGGQQCQNVNIGTSNLGSVKKLQASLVAENGSGIIRAWFVAEGDALGSSEFLPRL